MASAYRAESFEVVEVKPFVVKPGFCLKSRTIGDVKIFINVCHNEDVSKPDESLMSSKEVTVDDTLLFPLALGLPSNEKDKSGKDCICIHAFFNSEYLDLLLKDEDRRNLAIYLCIKGIATKYGISIRAECCKILKKPYHGNLQKRSFTTPIPSGSCDYLVPRNPGVSKPTD